MDEPSDMEDLDFSRADVAGDDQTCSGCQQAIGQRYFDVNGARTCERCGVAVRDGVGTPGGRFLRASLFGGGAAIISALVWYGIRVLTGYEVGLIAIAAGFLIGIAVRNGSGYRGGAGYQALAMMLTYSAIAVTYVPMVAEQLITGMDQDGAVEEPVIITAEDEAMAFSFVAYAFAVPIAFLVPILQVFDGGFMGLIILGIALYEAWKHNKKPKLQIEGPFELSAT